MGKQTGFFIISFKQLYERGTMMSRIRKEKTTSPSTHPLTHKKKKNRSLAEVNKLFLVDMLSPNNIEYVQVGNLCRLQDKSLITSMEDVA